MEAVEERWSVEALLLDAAREEGVELKIEEKDYKCRKILSNVSSAMRSSFRKCGLRKHVDQFMKESIFYKWLCLRLEMNLQEFWKSSWRMGILVWFY